MAFLIAPSLGSFSPSAERLESNVMLPPATTVPKAIQLARWLKNPATVLEESQARFGDIFTLRMTYVPTFVVLSDPSLVKEVFSAAPDELHAGKANVALQPFLGDHSLLMLDGAEHLRHRKLLLAPFHGERLSTYGDTMLTSALTTIARWPDTRPFTLHTEFQEITLDIIIRTVFGMEDPARAAAMALAMRETLDLAANPLLLVPALQKDLGPLSPWGRFMRKRKAADKLLYAELKRRRETGDTSRQDILSLLLRARDDDGSAMSDLELRDQLVTLLVAGHETTATALAWTFRWLLANRSLYGELEAEVLASAENGKLIAERLVKLPLLDAVIRESMRLQPVVPMVGRIVQKPFKLAGYELPEGTAIGPSIYLIQRRHGLYQDPSKFDPRRFIEHKFSPNEWFPFGGGIRRCIGMAFALYEMKMIIGAVIARTSLSLEETEPPAMIRRSITLAPKGGVRVTVRKKR
jgi:cytochrome P450